MQSLRLFRNTEIYIYWTVESLTQMGKWAASFFETHAKKIFGFRGSHGGD
jgi:hypothetical protein